MLQSLYSNECKNALKYYVRTSVDFFTYSMNTNEQISNALVSVRNVMLFTFMDFYVREPTH